MIYPLKSFKKNYGELPEKKTKQRPGSGKLQLGALDSTGEGEGSLRSDICGSFTTLLPCITVPHLRQHPGSLGAAAVGPRPNLHLADTGLVEAQCSRWQIVIAAARPVPLVLVVVHPGLSIRQEAFVSPWCSTLTGDNGTNTQDHILAGVCVEGIVTLDFPDGKQLAINLFTWILLDALAPHHLT